MKKILERRANESYDSQLRVHREKEMKSKSLI
jgi:hypothetical protein